MPTFPGGLVLDGVTLTSYPSATGQLYASPSGGTPVAVFDLNDTPLANITTNSLGFFGDFKTAVGGITKGWLQFGSYFQFVVSQEASDGSAAVSQATAAAASSASSANASSTSASAAQAAQTAAANSATSSASSAAAAQAATALTGVVRFVNSVAPDSGGNVVVATGGGGGGPVTLANLPAGVVVATASTVRPTARTDLTVLFTGADPTTNALDGDIWERP